MTDLLRPWADHQILSDMLAGLRPRLKGRGIFRTSVGSDWLRLNLEGDDRMALWLTWAPGANLVFTTEGPLDPILKRALPPVRRHPLPRLLDRATLADLGVYPADRIVALKLDRPENGPLFLLHQLYGARGNTVLLDEQNRLLWWRHRPPAPLLAIVPGNKVWATGAEGGSGNTVSRLALGHLITRLTSGHLQQFETALGRATRTAQRLVENLQQDFDRADQGESYRRKAEALAANLHLIKPGQAMLETADLRDNRQLKITLDPALSAAANMEAWFRRARKAEKGRDIILARLEEATAHADQLELAARRLEEIATSNCQELDCLEALLDWHQAHAGLLPATGSAAARAPGHGPEEPARPFRRYLVDEKYEVWVGRNNKENDLLTHRASHSKDIWLHAQGVAGSHVILRTAGQGETVPRAIIEKAGALAALNSKARHSSLVPVIYTERRYVRKPRKAPPGMAVCLREKNIFVEPGIPAGVRGI
jgi:predicted ribosome quality control (RQC) complex YloA/Tae2 family protein